MDDTKPAWWGWTRSKKQGTGAMTDDDRSEQSVALDELLRTELERRDDGTGFDIQDAEIGGGIVELERDSRDVSRHTGATPRRDQGDQPVHLCPGDREH